MVDGGQPRCDQLPDKVPDMTKHYEEDEEHQRSECNTCHYVHHLRDHQDNIHDACYLCTRVYR